MDVITFARKAHVAFLDRFAAQRFVFHHVPKCGGTSVGRALRMRYLASQGTVKPEPSFRALEAFTDNHNQDQLLEEVIDLRKQMLLYLLYEDVRALALHVPFSTAAWHNFRHDYKFLTMLREPVSRFISHYNWSSERPGMHGYIAVDFDEFLTTERAKRMGAQYVKMYADLTTTEDLRSEAGIAAAVANLRKFDVVGRLDDLPAFERDASEALGVRVRIGHENKAPGGKRVVSLKSLTPEQLARVHELCEPDLQVWNRFFSPELN